MARWWIRQGNRWLGHVWASACGTAIRTAGVFFHWSVEGPPPEQVEIKVYKRYSDRYETLKTTVPFSQLESQSITLKNR